MTVPISTTWSIHYIVLLFCSYFWSQWKVIHSRFDAGNRIPWDVTVLFKTHKFLLSFATASQCPFSSLCEFLLVATSVAGVRDRVTDWISAGQQSNLKFVARRILANQLRLCSLAIPAQRWNFGNACLERKTRKHYPRDNSDISMQPAGCKCVLWTTLSDSTSIKEAFSVTSIWLIFTVGVPSPLLRRYSLWRGGSLERSGTILMINSTNLQQTKNKTNTNPKSQLPL
jgi:hypothetical protein